MWRFAVVVAVLSLLLFVYPLWRLGTWLSIPLPILTIVVVGAFASQFVARFVLRNHRSGVFRYVRIAADLLLGVSPILLISVVIGEIAVGFNVLQASTVAIAIVVFLAGVVLLGIWRAWMPSVVRVELSSDKLDRPVRFAQISDVHIGSRSAGYLGRVMDRVVAMDPDFLCITGDFIDQTGIPVQDLQALTRLDKPIYFSSGNHERYEDFEAILERLRQLGVVVLRAQTAVQQDIQLIGIDDSGDPQAVAKILPSIDVDPNRYSILLYHRPQGLRAASEHGIDLKLSGHTHNGQIKPFHWAVRAQFEYVQGLYQHGQTVLYVNQGTGTWGPIMRVGTRSEITCFEVSPQ